MIPYAANEGSKRTKEQLRMAGWRVIVTPDHPQLPDRINFAIDNGEWSMRNQPLPHDFSRFADLVDRYGCAADFVVLPDIVGAGDESLALSISWIPRLRTLRNLLLPLQDGMLAEKVGNVLREHRNVGLFLGGTTEFKLREIYAWGMVAASWRRWYHVGRVNSIRRIRLCAEAGATSFDGSSAAIFSRSKLPRLDPARKQPSLLAPDGRPFPLPAL